MVKFPDRRQQIFGRESAIDHVTRRVARPGLTAVVGRPLMGKTWTLVEAARRLEDSGRYLVGYYECKGAEASHLLYAVMDLYTRWLGDASFLAQARSIWERHKEQGISKVGQMFGALIEKLAKAKFGEGSAALVRSAFDGLAAAQSDLANGGIQLTPLPYDQAQSLTQLVEKISDRKVVLILDAWEQSPSLRAESSTLEGFVKALDAWPNTHIVLGVRHPDMSGRSSEQAYQSVLNLCRLDPAVERYDLEPMSLEDSDESSRLTSMLRQNLQLAPEITNQLLLQMISGYPGVIKFWMNEARRDSLRTLEELRAVAGDAQSSRYPELDRQLSELREARMETAARLAFLPRLDTQTGNELRDWLLKDTTTAEVDTLVDDGILADEPVPTYGHDTCHEAARKWFTENKQRNFRRAAEHCIEELATRVAGPEGADRKYLEMICFCASLAQDLKVSLLHSCLLDAARTCFGTWDMMGSEIFEQNYRRVLASNSAFASLVSVALINRGAARSRRGDLDGGLADYNTVVDLAGAPKDQLAMALNNRGVIRSKQDDTAGAIADLSAAIDLTGVRNGRMASAYYNRALAKAASNDSCGAILDHTRALELGGLSVEIVIDAVHRRGALRLSLNDLDGAVQDFSFVIESPTSSVNHVAEALLYRGDIFHRRGNQASQLGDYTRIINLPGVHVSHRARAYNYRGLVYSDLGKHARALADFTFAIELPGAPPIEAVNAFENRGLLQFKRGHQGAAEKDWSKGLQVSGASSTETASVCSKVAMLALMQRQFEKAGQLYERVIQSAASGALVADAYFGRGSVHLEEGRRDAAMADFDAAEGHPHATEELKYAVRESRRRWG